MYGQDFLIIFFISLPNIFMKNKALNNLEAAQLLINNSCYTESVHCSYYAVLQYMKYMLNTTRTRAIPYEEQEYKGEDSHERIITEIHVSFILKSFSCKSVKFYAQTIVTQ